MVAVGIDLGTLCSCVAVWRQGNAEVIVNEHGNRTTPSYVAFTGSSSFTGETAKMQAASNPHNTIFGAKRLIGRRYYDTGVQMDLRHWPFRVTNINGKPFISVKYRGEDKNFTPEEISSMVIFRMKDIAERNLGVTVDKAVITVPAYFNDSQRQATRAAAAIAGLEVLRITNEPTAAALSYGIDRKGNRNVLIYDLGGGTFDVSVLSINDSVYQVKSTAGNTRLGGEDFDNRLVAYFADDFRKKFHMDITRDVKALRKLKIAAERAKRFLSSYAKSSIDVDSLCNGIDYSAKISRALFEDLCSDLFKATLGPVSEVLSDSRLEKKDIDDVVLVGGSTRIPKIQAMLREFFERGDLNISLNPEGAIACGAAIQAAILTGQRHEKISDIVLLDVVPLSLGIEIIKGIMLIFIERNTPIPCKRTKEITTLEDYQTSMAIEIFEGERSLTKDNYLLGVMELTGIPPAPRGVAKIDVTFDVDANGILSVSAQDRSTANIQGITIKNEQRLDQQQISKMIIDTTKYREEDMENKIRLESRNQLESFVYDVQRAVAEHGDKLTENDKVFMKNEFENSLQWLEVNTHCLSDEFQKQLTDKMVRWSKVLRKVYGPPRLLPLDETRGG